MDRNNLEPELRVVFVVKAVFARAHVRRRMQRSVCSNTTRLCDSMKARDGRKLYRDYILNVSFAGERRRRGRL